jgi:hypothetical protein
MLTLKNVPNWLSGSLFCSLVVCSGVLNAAGSKAPEKNESAPIEDPYVSDKFMWDAAEIALSELFRQEVYKNLSYNGDSFSGLLPQTDLNVLQSAFFGTVVRFLSENPALGGDFSRGFEPRIWNNIVRVMMERVIPMTPDGVLLLPTRPGARLAVLSPDLEAKGMTAQARIFLVDKQQQLLGPSMTPIKLKSFETLDGLGDMGVGSGWDDFAQGAQLQDQVSTQAVFVSSSKAEQDRIVIAGDEDYNLFDCFSLVAAGKGDDARLCFQKAGEHTLARAVELTLDVGETSARGAAAGAMVGWMMPGIGPAAGAAYGALTNVLMVGYNAFLKKEKISPNTMRRLMYFFSKHTYVPDVNGEIKVKPGMGRWVVTQNGLIRQATEIGGRLVALDINGDLITRERTVQITQGGIFSFPQQRTGENGSD